MSLMSCFFLYYQVFKDIQIVYGPIMIDVVYFFQCCIPFEFSFEMQGSFELYDCGGES